MTTDGNTNKRSPIRQSASQAIPSSAHATATMRANPGRDTGPEVRIRSALHARGLRFRKNLRVTVPTGYARPDVVFPREKLAVFIEGCFWHGCPQHGELPVANRDFWEAKISRTRQRDAEQSRRLIGEGWTVIRVWEHENEADAAERIAAAVVSARARLVRT